MCSARRFMVFNVCVKFHEIMSCGFKVMERTRKLLTDTHTHIHREKRRKHYTPMAYFVCRGYNDVWLICEVICCRIIHSCFPLPHLAPCVKIMIQSIFNESTDSISPTMPSAEDKNENLVM